MKLREYNDVNKKIIKLSAERTDWIHVELQESARTPDRTIP
jgi:hypothetical protein